MPILLVTWGALSSPVVDDDDVAELRRRQPTAEVVVVEGAGHSIQGDQPLALAARSWRISTSPVRGSRPGQLFQAAKVSGTIWVSPVSPLGSL